MAEDYACRLGAALTYAVYLARADVLALRPTTISIFRAGVCLELD
jgi:hypothetical protein